ncbi:MAG TPA: hypothetical protein VF212_03915 [Longimicrobiales bacterium]
MPETLRDELLECFNAVLRNYRQGHWEAAELNAGKLCEVVYTIIKGKIDGSFPARPKKPKNIVRACRDLEQTPEASAERALRIQIPRVLLGIYEMRNNRNVGHVGGDVDPSRMDAELAVAASRWMVADLVRIFHDVTTDEATRIVDALIERDVPLIWEGNGVKRVLDPNLDTRDKVLILLYASPGPVSVAVLQDWVEYRHSWRFREQILAGLHSTKQIEYDRASKLVYLLPPGAKYVEEVHLTAESAGPTAHWS